MKKLLLCIALSMAVDTERTDEVSDDSEPRKQTL